MNYPFDPTSRLIVVPAILWGPARDSEFRLALDTGAAYSLISAEAVAYLGYDLAMATESVNIVTGSGRVEAPRLGVSKVAALGQERSAFSFLCHTLPPAAKLDGLLGLDFLRGHRLVVDFRAGLLSLD